MAPVNVSSLKSDLYIAKRIHSIIGAGRVKVERAAAIAGRPP